MSRTPTRLFWVLPLLLGGIPLTGPLPAEDSDSAYRVLKRYCSRCHSEDEAEGGFDLTEFREPLGVLVQHRKARQVIAHLESGSMPPSGRRPSKEKAAAVIQWLRTTLEGADWEALREPVPIEPARMTRTEYTHTLRDLLGVSVDVSDLLPEESVGASGFVNDRGSLAMTESQLEQFIASAERAVQALLDSDSEPVKLHLEAEEGRHSTIQGVRHVKKLEDGTRGFEFLHHRGIKYQQVSRTFEFPRTGTYRFEIRAKTSRPERQGGVWIALDSVNDRRDEAVILIDTPEFKVYGIELFVTAGHHEVILGSDFHAVPWLPPVPDRPGRKLPRNRDEVVDAFYRGLDIQPVRWEEIRQLPGFVEPADRAPATLLVDELNRLLLDESIRVY